MMNTTFGFDNIVLGQYRGRESPHDRRSGNQIHWSTRSQSYGDTFYRRLQRFAVFFTIDFHALYTEQINLANV